MDCRENAVVIYFQTDSEKAFLILLYDALYSGVHILETRR